MTTRLDAIKQRDAALGKYIAEGSHEQDRRWLLARVEEVEQLCRFMLDTTNGAGFTAEFARQILAALTETED